MTQKPTLKALAAALNVSVRRVSELKRDGMSCDSIAAAKRWRRDREGSDGNSCERLRIERIKLVKIQRRRIELEVARTRGELIPRDAVKLSDTKIGCAVRGFSKAIENELPALCLGLPLERSRPLVRARLRELQEMLADEFSEFWKNFPEADGK